MYRTWAKATWATSAEASDAPRPVDRRLVSMRRLELFEAPLVGINSRDLETLEMDRARFGRLAVWSAQGRERGDGTCDVGAPDRPRRPGRAALRSSRGRGTCTALRATYRRRRRRVRAGTRGLRDTTSATASTTTGQGLCGQRGTNTGLGAELVGQLSSVVNASGLPASGDTPGVDQKVIDMPGIGDRLVSGIGNR
jgi:hypothetical protein